MAEFTSPMLPAKPLWRAYLELCKPRVVLLMLITAFVGMLLASPTWIPLSLTLPAILGIGLVSGAAAAVNHVVDQHIDHVMHRTQKRPLPTGQINKAQALWFALILSSSGLIILLVWVNWLTALLTFLTMLGYAVFYTVFLKRATPQNIVIGGLAGATPPLLGWTAVTQHIDPYGLLLVLLIFVWTPPHFWALAIHRHEDYARANVPMLPVTHGIQYTKLHVFLYTLLLCVVSILPYLVGMSGRLYLVGAVILGSIFVLYAWRLWQDNNPKIPMQTFRYSIYYLFLIFMLLLIDHYLHSSHLNYRPSFYTLSPDPLPQTGEWA